MGTGPESGAAALGLSPLGPREDLKMLVMVRAAKMLAFCASRPLRRVLVSWSRMMR